MRLASGPLLRRFPGLVIARSTFLPPARAPAVFTPRLLDPGHDDCDVVFAPLLVRLRDQPLASTLRVRLLPEDQGDWSSGTISVRPSEQRSSTSAACRSRRCNSTWTPGSFPPRT